MNNIDSKGNLKRSLKNKKTNNKDKIIISNNKEINEEEKNKDDSSKKIALTNRENKNENIVIKSEKNKEIETINEVLSSKDKKGDLIDNNNDDNNTLKIKSDSKRNLIDDDIVIHQSKSSKKELLSSSEKEKGDGFKEKKDKKNFDDFELNHLEYSEALQYDHRLFLRIYWSLLKREHSIIHTFLSWNDYNLFFVKLSKFFFLVTTIMALDALFFSNDAMHNIYSSGGSFNFGAHMVQMVLSIIVYEVFQILLNYLTLTDIDYYKIKGKKDTITQKELISIIKCIKYKIMGFYISTFLIFLFYWYLNSAFCAVYEYTQGPFAIDSFVCLIFAWIYPLALYLLPTGLRKISFICLRMKGLKIIYRISQFIPVF